MQPLRSPRREECFVVKVKPVGDLCSSGYKWKDTNDSFQKCIFFPPFVLSPRRGEGKRRPGGAADP